MAAHDREEASGNDEREVGSEGGKMRSALLLWLLGIPLPIILLILLFGGC